MLTKRTRRGEEGFTLVEMAFVMLIMSIVLVIAGDALISLQNATNHVNAMVRDEQDASNTLVQMARDIRSAHAIAFPSSTTDAADAVILYVNQPSGGTVPVEWVYQPPSAPAVTGTLTRYVLNGDLSVASTRVELSDVGNGGNPVFTYYNLFGQPMATAPSSTQNTTITNCSTAIGATLSINPAPVRGVNSFQESTEAAITDQEQALSAPGDSRCGTYGY